LAVEGSRARVAAASAAGLRAEAELLLGDLDWIGVRGQARSSTWRTHLRQSRTIRRSRRGPARSSSTTQSLTPRGAIERAEQALATLKSEQVPAAVASVAFDLYWAELLLGHGARQSSSSVGEELEDKAGPEASKSVIPLIYFTAIDDFDAARNRHAVEAEWYHVRGEEGGRRSASAHLGFAEFRAGRWDLAERLVEDSCTTIAQLERPWTMPFRIRSLVDAGRGRTGRARTTLLPLIDEAHRSGGRPGRRSSSRRSRSSNSRDEDHAAVDAALTDVTLYRGHGRPRLRT
jgi:hypothetical protein